MKTTFRLLLAAALVALVLLPGTGSASGPGGVDRATTGEGSANALPDDADGDGVLDDDDNCPNWSNPAQGLPTWSLAGNDFDCDGFNADLETYLGTAQDAGCPATTAAGDEPIDAWPTDFNDNKITNLPDVISFGPTFNKLQGQQGYDKRHDLNMTNQVLLSDVILMGPYFNRTCLPPPPSSEFLIGQALEDGEITYEDSLLYRAYALYQTPDLPAEFSSPVVDYHAARALFSEVLENESTLSPEFLADIEPFRARPSDPISIHNNPPLAEGAAISAAAPFVWQSQLAAGGKVRVWATNAGILADRAATTTAVWTELQGVFPFDNPDTPGAAGNNPDNAIDVYFPYFGDVDPRRAGCDAVPTPAGCRTPRRVAETRPVPPKVNNTSSGYVLVDRMFTGADLAITLAHELAHVGQNGYDYKESDWLADATAEWAAVRVAQELPESRQPTFDNYSEEFFDGLHRKLTRNVDLNRYGSWQFFFHASMDQGDGIVTNVWQNAAAPGVQSENAVDLVYPFVDNFDDFAVHNWNQLPVDPLYRSPSPGDPTFPTLKPDLHKTKNFTTTFEEVIAETPVGLSAMYYRYTFANPVRKVTFLNDIVANQDAHIWAIPKIGGQWKEPEDWSRDQKIRYCRDYPDEDLQEVIIILSNSHKQNNLPGGPKLRTQADTESCKGFIGTATATYHQAFSQGEYTEDWTVTANILWEEDEDYFFGCGCRPFFPTGEIDWQWSFSYPDPPCNDLDAGTVEAGTGLTDPGEQMLILWEDAADLTQYFYSVTGQVPGTWFSDCEGGDRCCLTFIDIPIPDVVPVTPTVPPTMPPTPAPAPLLLPVSVAVPVPGSESSAATATVFCPDSEFSFPRDANVFSGSCFAGYTAEPNDFLRYDWNFTRIGGVP